MKSFMFIFAIVSSFLLGSCGSDQGAASSPATYTIGGMVSGLTGSGLVLQDNSGNNLSVTTNGSFTFTTAIASGGAYSVTVLSQPSSPSQTCAVTSGRGAVSSANVTSVQLTCTNIYTIGGTISGLSGSGLVLQNNGGNNLPVSAGATGFTFTTTVTSGATYNVTISSQPSNPSQTCGVTNGSGAVISANVTSVAISCTSPGGFVLTGSMTTARMEQTATLLNNGQVLIAGGKSATDFLASAELYDTATGTFTATGSMTTARYNPTARLLNNGQVLIAGGSNDISSALASAELYDPATGIFTATGSMTDGRRNATATLLNNGQVLFAGGDDAFNTVASAELYDPATGTFTVTGSMTTTRDLQTATLLNNGQVLIAGGESATETVVASAELYDPATGTFTATGSMTTARHYQTATLLNNGQVLIADGGGNGIDLASAELYDTATGTFTATGSMTTARFDQTATLLNNGMVLIAGGYNGIDLASAELYDTATGTFTATGSMTNDRDKPTATLLNNGQVLIVGGDIGAVALASAELYLPSTLTPTGLVSITVTPADPTLSVGSTQQFVATGTFSDNSTQILQSVNWSSSNVAATTISNDSSNHGVALALAAGNSTITASAGSISGSTVLTVQ